MEFSVLNPFLDNIETLGGKRRSKKKSGTVTDRARFNRYRGKKISDKCRTNQVWRDQLNHYLISTVTTDNENEHFFRLRNNLQNCCSKTLLRKHFNPVTIEYIASHTCKNKLCNVCNYVRSKTLRRKVMNYFKRNELIDRKTGEVFTREDFDFMHLTLTVPHTKAGWRGKQVYSTELMQAFNTMRKREFWKYHVFAGEFGVEFTRNENGIHAHIHSLLIVHKEKGNRNLLHKEILAAWNELTVCATANRKSFTPEDLEAIKKGNKLIDDAFLQNLIPSGSTFISLESLFTYNKIKTNRYDRYDSDKSAWKHYINPDDEKEFISGVMECIKYHFEPMALKKDDNELDFDLLKTLLPAIKGKPLYRKFGAWHGLKELNLNDNTLSAAEISDDMTETAHDEVIHPVTGRAVETTEYGYIVVNAKCLFYNGDELTPMIKSAAKITKLFEGISLREALLQMMQTGWKDADKQRNVQEILLQMEIPDENSF